MNFKLTISSLTVETTHLAEFSEEICNVKHFLYSVSLYFGMQKHAVRDLEYCSL